MQHHFIQKSLFLISVCFSLLVLLSCSEQKVKDKPQDQTSDKTLSLAKWFEANGNYINSDEVPSIVDAQLVYALRDEISWLLILGRQKNSTMDTSNMLLISNPLRYSIFKTMSNPARLKVFFCL